MLTNFMEFAKKNLLELSEFDFSASKENLHLLVYSAVSFFIPLLLKQPQLLVGSAVNSMLILSALNLRTVKIIPAIILPSIAAVLGGVLFGGLTIYLLYMMPFIWCGNLTLVLLVKKLKLADKRNYIFSLGTAAVIKTAIIFSAALFIAPKLLFAMGPIQLVTAVIGGSIAFAGQKIINF